MLKMFFALLSEMGGNLIAQMDFYERTNDSKLSSYPFSAPPFPCVYTIDTALKLCFVS